MAVRPADVTCRRWIAILLGCGWIAAMGLSLEGAENSKRRTESATPTATESHLLAAAPDEDSSDKNERRAARPLSSDDARLTTLTQGTSSNDVRTRCIKRLPYHKFSKKSRKQVDDILDNISLFRQLPTYEFETHHDAYRYFTSHPDVAVSIWRVMKISQFQMFQTGRDNFEADAGDGTVGTIDVLYRSATQNVILCEGSYKTPFLPKAITAKALIHLQSEYRTGTSGQPVVRHRADLFVSLPSQTVEAAAILISPLSNVIIDRNFHDISVFMHMMSMAMSRQPGWVEQTARQMEGVLKIRRAELVDVTAKVYADWLHEQRIETISGEQGLRETDPAPIPPDQEPARSSAPSADRPSR